MRDTSTRPLLSPTAGAPDMRPAGHQDWGQQAFAHVQFDAPDTLAANARGELTPLQYVNVRAATPGSGPSPIAVLAGIVGLTACVLAAGVGLLALAGGSVAGLALAAGLGSGGVPLVAGGLALAMRVRPPVDPRIAWVDGAVVWHGADYVPALPGGAALPFRVLWRGGMRPLGHLLPGPYRFYYHPATGTLLSAQPLVARAHGPSAPTQPPAAPVTAAPVPAAASAAAPAPTALAGRVHWPFYHALCAAGGFEPDALSTNEVGTLTPTQESWLSERLRSRPEPGNRSRTVGSILTGLALIGGGAAFVMSMPGAEGLPGGLLVALLGLALAIGAIRAHRRLAQDLAAGRVAMGEGVGRAIALHRGGEGRRNPRWRLRVGPETFPIDPPLANAIHGGLTYRVYYLPGSRFLLQVVPVSPPADSSGEARPPGPLRRAWRALRGR